MVIVVRLDLDRYDLKALSALIRDQVITISEASESRAFKELSEYDQLMMVRDWQKTLKKKAEIS